MNTLNLIKRVIASLKFRHSKNANVSELSFQMDFSRVYSLEGIITKLKYLAEYQDKTISKKKWK